MDRSSSFDPRVFPRDALVELYSVPSHATRRPEIVRAHEIGSSKRTLLPGTVLICKINPRINRVWVVGDFSKFGKIGSTEWIPFFPSEAFEPSYLAYYLRQDQVRNFLAANVSGVGGSLMRVRPAVIDAIPVVLPPKREQRSIVAALDAHFSRLDEAEAGLERVQRNLKRYRASVLQAAVTGRLVPTEAELARAERRAYEPAAELLQRILAERRRKWQESGKRGTYQEPAPPDTANLRELPEGWCWATAEQIAHVKGGITKNNSRRSREPLRKVAYLRVANVQRGYLDLTSIATIPATESEIEELRLQVGDVLFNEGGDRDKLGRGWIWGGELSECIHQNHVFRARLFTGDVLPKYLSWYGNTAGQRYFFEEGKQTTNLASINMTKLRGLPVAVPPLAEQLRIASEVERLVSVAAEEESQVLTSLARAGRLRQSILKWAFEGRLVDQDPGDEPAGVLLERIRAERAAAGGGKAKPTRRGRRSR